MICAVNTPERERRFLAALEGEGLPAPQLAAHWQAFGASPGSGWQFYTTGAGEPPMALSVKGGAAQCCGRCDPEELGSFLRFLGVHQLHGRIPPPAGCRPAAPVCQLRFAPGAAALPCDGPLPAGLELLREPPMGPVTRLVMEAPELAAAGSEFYDEFYARGCALRNRGLARVWAIQGPGGQLLATAGIYGIHAAQGYLAAVHTRSTLRRQGLGGWLVTALARSLAAEGIGTALWCSPALLPFYRSLGFLEEAPMPRFEPEQQSIE